MHPCFVNEPCSYLINYRFIDQKVTKTFVWHLLIRHHWNIPECIHLQYHSIYVGGRCCKTEMETKKKIRTNQTSSDELRTGRVLVDICSIGWKLKNAYPDKIAKVKFINNWKKVNRETYTKLISTKYSNFKSRWPNAQTFI